MNRPLQITCTYNKEDQKETGRHLRDLFNWQENS